MFRSILALQKGAYSQTQSRRRETVLERGGEPVAHNKEKTMLSILRRPAIAVLLAPLAALLVGAPHPALAAIPVQQLDACGPISVSGYYAVVSDLSANSGDCFTIAVPNVTLDLAGTTLSGSGAEESAGIRVLPAATGVQIQHGTVTGFAIGIDIAATEATVTRVSLPQNGIGARFSQADGGQFERNVVSQTTQHGLVIENSSQVSVVVNQIDTSGVYGVWLKSTDHSLVAGNTVDGAGDTGIYLGCSPSGISNVLDCPPSLDNSVGRNSVTNSGSVNIGVDAGNTLNMVLENTTSGAGAFDLADATAGCDSNRWLFNTFGNSNQSCVQ